MNIKQLNLHRPANARIISLISLGLIPLLSLVWMLVPDSLTMRQAETASTSLIVASLIYLIITSVLVHRTIVHTYIFFLGCVSLFVGGRFLSHAAGFDIAAMGMETNIFSVHRPDFVTISMSAKEGVRLSVYIATCLYAIHAGYMFTISRQSSKIISSDDIAWAWTLSIPSMILAAISTVVFLISFPDVYNAVHSDGYLSLYKSASSDFTTRGSTAAQYGLLIALGLAFASNSRWLGWTVMALLGAYYIANLQLGVRGGIMGFSLLCIWLFHTRVKRIDRLALIAIPAILAVLVTFAAFGPRAGNFGEKTALYLPWFIDNQGLTVLYIHSAMQIDSYPTLAYFHSIFPAVPTFFALAGQSVPLDQLYFGQFLSKITLSGDAYQQGFGMGWSVFADFYAYTLWIPGLYLIAAGVFGILLAKLVSSTNPLVFGAHVMIFVKIMLLPRTGLYSIAPFLLAYFGILASCYFFHYIYAQRNSYFLKR